MARSVAALVSPFLTRLSQFTLATLVVALLSVASGAQPVFVSAASRMSHGAQTFDVSLPQTGPGGVECRSIAGGITLVITFDRALKANVLTTATVTAGTANAGAPTVSGTSLLVPLTGVVNPNAVTLQVSNITDTTDAVLASKSVFFRVCGGDVNGSGTVNVSDINSVKLRAGTDNGVVNLGTFRCDYNLSGTINVSDVNVIKAAINTSSPGGATPNTIPTISAISPQTTPAGNATPTVAFTVGDAETPPANLFVNAVSSDQTILPDANISLGGTGASRSIACAPAANQLGTVTVTVTVSDGLATAFTTFTVAATGPEKLFVTTLRPESSAIITSGSGYATLTLSSDRSYATLRITYSNLTSPKTNMHVHGPSDPFPSTGGIIFDIDAATPQADGSFRWDIVQSGATTVQDILTALDAGRTYLNIHTVNFGSGELRGHFVAAAGSQVFIAPPDPGPADLATANITDPSAARFLTQAAFGLQADGSFQLDGSTPSNHTIAKLKTVGYDAWFTQQFAATPTSMRSILLARAQDLSLAYTISGNEVTETWWKMALTSDDQLRQRVAFALSQIFVISRTDENIDNQIIGLTNYHDMLATDAFGNFRTLLKDVTLSPMMGQYLNMRGNTKQSNASSPKPNENYAREVLQLFSVGLNELWPDGTLKLGTNGLPTPTYDQTTIEQFAKVFTGFRENPVDVVFDGYNSAALPTPIVEVGFYHTDYINQMVLTNTTSTSGGAPILTATNHDFTSKVLLQGSPVNTTISAYSTSGQSTSQQVTRGNLELDQAIDNIFQHPNIGPFIARRLIQRLVTSAPSPGFIYRVTQVFNSNPDASLGTLGERGNMKAVIKAILTDYEARTGTLATTQGYGKVKEPLARTAQVIRALHPYSNGLATGYNSGNYQYWRLQGTTTDFGQTPYAALTVFNFYQPDFTVPIPLANSNNVNEKYTLPVISPEMDITTENSTIYIPRMYKKGIIDAPLTVNGSGSGFNTQSSSTTDIRVNLIPEEALCPGTSSAAVAIADFDPLLNYLNKALMAGQMPAEMKLQIGTYLKNNVTTTSLSTLQIQQRRTRVAVYLIVTSPFFSVQR